MKLLAIDTSSLACSVALDLNGEIIERHEEQAREHTRLLMPMIQAILADGALRTEDLDAVVLGNGPGSFIGMRIAASVAQGIAHGAGLDIVPVSSLAAVAAQVFEETDAEEVVVAQDAHMNEVYLGAYRQESANELAEIFPERLQTQTRIEELSPEQATGCVAAGFGWERYPDLAAANAAVIGQLSGVQHPHARYLLPLGAAALSNGVAISPADLVPAYLRSKVAEKPAG
ncbi:MAG: tRNA (adenosine(37)-N6)-threonylcarbamoyltransferase complex dimerization subunit type 1 TsaB [Gammaproteobacteria bacterium]|nr:tRNA (adenosine(37)-N6)-threonylcarbamoyltransferase complex dimerization subunit type 1 TsaB [Gammaproteobacteria bacterium]